MSRFDRPDYARYQYGQHPEYVTPKGEKAPVPVVAARMEDVEEKKVTFLPSVVSCFCTLHAQEKADKPEKKKKEISGPQIYYFEIKVDAVSQAVPNPPLGIGFCPEDYGLERMPG